MNTESKFAPTREEAIESVRHLSVSNRYEVLSAGRQHRRIELTILVLSVLTSGALWILIAQSFEKVAAWGGAAISTLVLILMLYQRTLGPDHRLEQLRNLQKRIDELLIGLQSGPRYDAADYQRRVKDIVADAIPEKYRNRDLTKLTLAERQEFEQYFPQ